MRTILATEPSPARTATTRARHPRTSTDRLTLTYICAGVAIIFASSVFPQLKSMVFLALGAATAVVIIASVRVRRPALVWPWVCLVLAFSLFIVDGATRVSLGTLGDLTPSRSLIPDLLAIPGYLLLIVALLGFSRSRVRGECQIGVILDAAIAALALGSLVWAFVVEPVLANQRGTGLVKFVLTAYPPLSIFLVVVVLRIVFNGSGKHVPAFWLCLGAMAFMFVGDGLYMAADVNLLKVPSSLIDVPYAAAFLLAGAMALHPSMRELTEPGSAAQPTTSIGRALLVAGALLVAALMTLQSRLFTGNDRIVMFALYVALTAAVGARIAQALHVAARSESRLAYLANHDELTGLPNRRLMEEQLAKRLRSASAQDKEVAVLFLDLDRFKLVNDTLGHGRGDDLLVQVSRRLVANVRPSDFVARIGGDEFMILLDHSLTPQEAMDLANRLRLCLKDPFVLNGIEFYISASVGLAFASGDDPDVTTETLVRDADTAMYQAKEGGRDTVAVFDESMRDEVEERVELERDLRNAVALRQLHLVYQPIVALPRGPAVGMEALIRWAHPTRGVLSPNQFVHIAEDIGMISEIGNWVMEEAASQLAAWCRYAPELVNTYVSVNLSSAQLRDEGIVDRVADVLAFNGLPGRSLCLELTESMAMQDPMAAAAILSRLRRLGVGVALDDFGAEYSSLAYLKRLPATVLKIDKSFVDSLLQEDTADASLIAAVVATAKSLGITTVAEGVESSLQARRLVRLGVDAVQGYLFSRPVTADKLLEVTKTLSASRLTLVGAGAR